jgi:hypothetical protein
MSQLRAIFGNRLTVKAKQGFETRLAASLVVFLVGVYSETPGNTIPCSTIFCRTEPYIIHVHEPFIQSEKYKKLQKLQTFLKSVQNIISDNVRF